MCLCVDMARVRPASLKLVSLDTDKIEFLSVRSHTAWTQSSTQEQNHRNILNITVVEMENEIKQNAKEILQVKQNLKSWTKTQTTAWCIYFGHTLVGDRFSRLTNHHAIS